MSEALTLKLPTYRTPLIFGKKTLTAQRKPNVTPGGQRGHSNAHLSLVFLLKAAIGLLGILLETLQKERRVLWRQHGRETQTCHIDYKATSRIMPLYISQIDIAVIFYIYIYCLFMGRICLPASSLPVSERLH